MFLMYAMLPFLLYNPVDEKKLASRVSLSSLSSGVIEECTVGALYRHQRFVQIANDR
jgi:hypothetical protein